VLGDLVVSCLVWLDGLLDNANEHGAVDDKIWILMHHYYFTNVLLLFH